MGPLRIFAALVFLYNSAIADQIILVDRSGSMRPYYQQDIPKVLAKRIFQACTQFDHAQLAVFSSTVSTIDGFDDRGFGYLRGPSSTLIDNALDFAIEGKYTIAWILTDNIEDEPGSVEAGNTEKFYQRLRENVVQKVVIFPILQSSGNPGLILYGILLSPRDDVFEKSILEVQEVLGREFRTEALRMKPLDRNTVEIVILKNHLLKKKKISEGDSIEDSLEVRFKSKFEHLRISDALIQEPKLIPEFEKGSILEPQTLEWTITPNKIRVLDPFQETQQIYRVRLKIGNVKLKKDLGSLMTAAFGKPREDFTVGLSFLLKVEQGNFQFKDSFLQTFNANSIAEAKSTGKIYGLTGLPALLGAGTIPIATEAKLQFGFDRPWWPSLVLIALVLLALILLSGLGILLFRFVQPLLRQRDWNVKITTKGGEPLDCACEDGTVTLRGEEIGKVQSGEFVPSPGIQLQEPDLRDEAKETIRVQDGTKLRFKKGIQEYFLVFMSKEQDHTKGSHQPYVPTQR